jgi:Late exocytosis, associated with Golgi transport
MGQVCYLQCTVYLTNTRPRLPSPPTPRGWPLSWVGQAIRFPEDEIRRLRGVDATLYVRFLRGCCKLSALSNITLLKFCSSLVLLATNMHNLPDLVPNPCPFF